MNLHRNESIKKELFINCQPKTLFSFFTDPEKLVRWMGQSVLLDPSIGGKYRIDINGHDIAMGEYVEIVPYEKIVMTWGWSNLTVLPPGSSTLEFRLIPKDGGTLLILTHYDLPEEKIPTHIEGWNHYMLRLQFIAEGNDPGMDPWSKRK
ncbi:SRPBCC family protein [Peribacillus alkalitolerans]|uniref:SRPBCC family protein n=1 Tax=Peribacillus alkalitolerans TaxID=1550385 RepID=UPI0013D00996|nr:SRPBCC domain-containing protein [Peribacillus alkalitolerans]